MNSVRRGVLILMFAALFLSVLGWAPSAGATPLCSAGLVSSITGTTCDIGNLHFTFGAFVSDGVNFDAGTSTYTIPPQLPLSNFSFTPVSGGFAISFSGTSPVTVNSPDSEAAGSYVTQEAYILYQVTDTDPGGLITGMGISGGTLSSTTSGSSDQLYIAGYDVLTCATFAEDNCAGADASSINGTNTPPGAFNVSLTPFGTGLDGTGVVFTLEADSTGSVPGGFASWDGTTPTTFTFNTTRPVSTPEPGSSALLATGLMGMLAIVFWRRKRLAA